jgi:hypothetical protein
LLEHLSRSIFLFALSGKEKPMVRLITFVMLGLLGVVALVGCRAEGELDVATNVVAPQ